MLPALGSGPPLDLGRGFSTPLPSAPSASGDAVAREEDGLARPAPRRAAAPSWPAALQALRGHGEVASERGLAWLRANLLRDPALRAEVRRALAGTGPEQHQLQRGLAWACRTSAAVPGELVGMLLELAPWSVTGDVKVLESLTGRLTDPKIFAALAAAEQRDATCVRAQVAGSADAEAVDAAIAARRRNLFCAHVRPQLVGLLTAIFRDHKLELIAPLVALTPPDELSRALAEVLRQLSPAAIHRLGWLRQIHQDGGLNLPANLAAEIQQSPLAAPQLATLVRRASTYRFAPDDVEAVVARLRQASPQTRHDTLDRLTTSEDAGDLAAACAFIARGLAADPHQDLWPPALVAAALHRQWHRLDTPLLAAGADMARLILAALPAPERTAWIARQNYRALRLARDQGHVDLVATMLAALAGEAAERGRRIVMQPRRAPLGPAA